jgi:hypothetical protein
MFVFYLIVCYDLTFSNIMVGLSERHFFYVLLFGLWSVIKIASYFYFIVVLV